MVTVLRLSIPWLGFWSLEVIMIILSIFQIGKLKMGTGWIKWSSATESKLAQIGNVRLILGTRQLPGSMVTDTVNISCLSGHQPAFHFEHLNWRLPNLKQASRFNFPPKRTISLDNFCPFYIPEMSLAPCKAGRQVLSCNPMSLGNMLKHKSTWLKASFQTLSPASWWSKKSPSWHWRQS